MAKKSGPIPTFIHTTRNPGKYHYIVISDDDLSQKLILNNTEIGSSSEK